MDRNACWSLPRNEALHCDQSERLAQALTRLGAFEHRLAGDATTHLLLGPGSEEPTPEEQLSFVEEHLAFARAIRGVRWAESTCYAWTGSTGPCLALVVDHCTGPTLDEVAKYATRWAKGIDLAHKRFPVVVRIGGKGPRCSVSDPSCVPRPYNARKAEYVPGAAREIIRKRYELPLDEWPASQSPCEHDGDCLPACHDCVSWVEPGADACSQEYRTQLEHALCGCIAGHCSWFNQ